MPPNVAVYGRAVLARLARRKCVYATAEDTDERARDWLRNARGEWYVLGQGLLSLAVVLAPRVDGTPSLGSGAVIAGAVLCAAGCSARSISGAACRPSLGRATRGTWSRTASLLLCISAFRAPP